MQRFLVSLLGIAAVLFGLHLFFNAQYNAGLGLAPEVTQSAPTAEQSPDEAPAPAVSSSIDIIGVTPAQRIPDYDRDLFGEWADPDGNGCRTRDDILARDMTAVTTENGCKVLSGILADPYSGKTVNFTFGAESSQAVQIDHIVALSAAWKGGAHAWPEQTRVAFANDPRNLLAVDGPTNSSKSDKGPSAWMPATAGNASYDCAYATSYVDILVNYQLTAPAEDLNALRTALATC